ncbi:hypothetical protein N0O92_05110 [Alkalihalobacillus sp. MEB130]|uniref:hypothetical protein n=1 Tax=Alkalihalobacillus sp. MEB130 TaxID=2976704 RepID=UPI0028DE3021|nr:hypothetical protein [Alkalihalobacillus sp. MEB130]MDT8859605.1 hypothetical protein [Alkalihalobacillus sp. MEB130]
MRENQSKKQDEKDQVQPPNAEKMDIVTMGDMSLEKAERLHFKKPELGGDH